MNAVLLDARRRRLAPRAAGASALVRARRALSARRALLFVAAQAGFVDGPRVMANMAIDSWLPHRFAALSERLSMQNGVLLMGGTSIAALLYTHGDVDEARRHVLDQRVSDVLAVEPRDGRFWIKHRKEHAGLVRATCRCTSSASRSA